MTIDRLARRYVGRLQEIAGPGAHPLIVAMLRFDNEWVQPSDEIAWCSAFVNFLAFHLGLERTKRLNARSWLTVGDPVSLTTAQPGDIVILMRGTGPQPGPDVVEAPGHVAVLLEVMGTGGRLRCVGGNQQNAVTVETFERSRVLGLRRLKPEGAPA